MENNMKKLLTICFALALTTCGIASAQDHAERDHETEQCAPPGDT